MERNETPLLNLYAVRKSQNDRFIIITLVEGQKPNRTFRKWLVPTSQTEGKPLAVLIDGKVHLELPLSKEFKKEAPVQDQKPVETIDEDDIPF
jgi:hypothetical protein